ncbi:mevalonate kinase [Nocardia sp. NBC_01503]|uniref:mevalonate kinase n=1 Tax=Nocardia sp. NBC_01503 TaxID=2975997 RepID=UPI002E7B28CE|nr:mevalonate kinase [Nocardia sp. NBC_01503]WTL29540.1 mevalonate kinase [Nocardia sp. NBC_01503]
MTSDRAAVTADDRTVGTGRAHGKVVLLGEHAVVHGMPAIAVPLPALTVTACARIAPNATPVSMPGADLLCGRVFRCPAPPGSTVANSGPQVAAEQALKRWKPVGGPVEIRLVGDIPVARGLGSSAAYAAAAVRAVADLCGEFDDPDTLYELVQYGEQLAHGRASGVDARAVLAAGPIWFQHGIAHPINTGLDATFVVADSGIASGTRQAVTAVRAEFDRRPLRARRLLDWAREITEAAAQDLADGDAPALGAELTDFQAVLTELGVSTAEIDRLIAVARQAGALGAKLTGGGLGGCILALTAGPAEAEVVSTALRTAGATQTWTFTTGDRP